MIELIGKNGSGKTFIANELGKQGYEKIIGYTTRPMRENEINKVDYYFITKQEFEYMLHNNQLLDYKVRNGYYYGISKDGITKSSIIISGNSTSIASATGFDVYRIYLDANLKARYRRMIKRNQKEDLFDRIHSENFSFLDDFQAFFIDNSTDNISIIDDIKSVMSEGVIFQSVLKDNKHFIQKKVQEYESIDHQKQSLILDILEYEEYLLRCLALMKDINKEKQYYQLMREYLNRLKIDYEEKPNKLLVLRNNKVYNFDYKER